MSIVFFIKEDLILILLYKILKSVIIIKMLIIFNKHNKNDKIKMIIKIL